MHDTALAGVVVHGLGPLVYDLLRTAIGGAGRGAAACFATDGAHAEVVDRHTGLLGLLGGGFAGAQPQENA